jgi:uncharacterized protein involved in type VI secretion and phage assembly
MRPVEGIVIGIVKEIDAEHASVKLEFPWMNASYRSNWARVAMPMSGNGRGFFMMPEKDDEVLVGFDRCNMDHPYVVGFVWNGVDKPSEKTNKNRVILTPGGHTLRFEDTEDKKKLVLRSSAGHEILFDDTDAGQTITVKMKQTGTQIVLDDKSPGSISLEGGGRKLELKGNKVQVS